MPYAQNVSMGFALQWTLSGKIVETFWLNYRILGAATAAGN
jgi:hypothetical protein